MKAFAVGGVDYITKPFSEEEVFARVENILTIRKLQQQLKQLEVRQAKSEANYQSLFKIWGLCLVQMAGEGEEVLMQDELEETSFE